MCGNYFIDTNCNYLLQNLVNLKSCEVASRIHSTNNYSNNVSSRVWGIWFHVGYLYASMVDQSINVLNPLLNYCKVQLEKNTLKYDGH
jgi:hypothetical protein